MGKLCSLTATSIQARRKMFMQMTAEGTRGEKRRRDADDFDPEAKIMRKLFVKNLPGDATEGGVRQYFEQFGLVEACDVPTEREGDKTVCKGYGFLVFEKAAGVDAVQAARPHTVNEAEVVTKVNANVVVNCFY